MKNNLAIILVCLAGFGWTACKNNNPSGTPKPNDTAFMVPGADSSSGNSAGGAPAGNAGSTAPTDTSGQNKDSANKH